MINLGDKGPVQRAKEIVVISGKGGTGKTSLVASFAELARQAVIADCDVDAADLHLVLEPRIIRREAFTGGKRARIEAEQCTACGKCEKLCRFDAIRLDGPTNGFVEKTFRIDEVACEGCGVCAWFCSERAIEFGPVTSGEWFVSETRFGPMVHAQLGVAQENSGRLVTIVRTNAKRIAEQRGVYFVLVDGSPGIGCPVIASITGAELALIVTEPTLSGLHDLERVADLTRHFGVRTMVCINKWDVNADLTGQIEATVRHRGLTLAGRVGYDRAFTEAQVRRQAVTEYQKHGSASDVRAVWEKLKSALMDEVTEMPESPIAAPGRMETA